MSRLPHGQRRFRSLERGDLINICRSRWNREGFDLDLISGVAAELSIPVVAHGGAGVVSDIPKGIKAGADAVALASMLHYGALEKRIFNPRSTPKTVIKNF